MKRNMRSSAVSAYRSFRRSRAGRILFDRGVLNYLLAFLIPSVLMLIGFAVQGIHPFGSQQMLVVDLWHQYYPFFRVESEKLRTGGSFLYSWQNGMGTNFLSLISYYAASPLNLLSVFSSNSTSRDALTYILVAKIGFSGAFFNRFLRYTYKRRDFSTPVFSAMFALCSYMLGYYWNVMWFDTVALFPLVMTGLTALCREGKWKLYTAALALSLISNYYVGFFTCVFTLFAFFAAAVTECRGVKDFFRKLWLIARSSAIGIALGAFLLVPAYEGLKLTYSINNHFPETVKWYEKWYDIIANLISYSEPAKKDGLPNFACGMLAVVLFGVFLFSAGIKIREKIASVSLLAFIFVSCNLNVLNYIWHGFHATNQIPYRFAFIFCFLLVAAAYRAYDVMTAGGIRIYQLFLLVPAPAFVLGLNVWKANKSGEGFSFDGAFRASAIITAAYLLVFIAGRLFPFRNRTTRRRAINAALAAAVITELTSNTIIGVKTVGSSSYTSYPYLNDNVQELLSDMREDDESLFSRSEIASVYTLNDGALYGYNGVSQFSSMANVSVTRYFRKLGLYSSEAGNRYYYRNSTPMVNDLLGINYIISKGSRLNNSEMSLEHISESGSSHLYRSRYPMSIGFMMNSDVLKLELAAADNPFEFQNDVVMLGTGSKHGIFTRRSISDYTFENAEGTSFGSGSCTYEVTDPNEKASATLICDGVEGAYLYGYVNGGAAETIDVKCDGIPADSNIAADDYPIAFPMGNGQEGSVIETTLNFEEKKTSGTFNVQVYALDEEAFDKAYSAFADEQLELTEFSDTRLKGWINVRSRGLLYLSIPYENGWSVFVDGEKVPTVKVFDAMLGAEIGPGEHEVELRYFPDGLGTGIIISLSAAAVSLLLLAAEKAGKKRRRARREAAVSADSNNGTEDVEK
ncbi:MAG: YfhO family protein [Ruminococcus sp.]|nr:YfhO family protein [Ruminococcus sp.]